MDEKDNVKLLYDELKDTYDLGSEEDFRSYLSDSNKREALRKELENDYEVGDSTSFSNYLGFGNEESVSEKVPDTPTVTGEQTMPNVTGAQTTQQQPDVPAIDPEFEASAKIGGVIEKVKDAPAPDTVPGTQEWRNRTVNIPGENPYNGQTYGAVYDSIIQDFGKNMTHPDVDPYAEARAKIMQAGITDDLKPEDADKLALKIREGYANRYAEGEAKNIVSALPDQVPNIDQLMDGLWYTRDLQNSIAHEAQRLGLRQENYVNYYVKPQIAKALSDRYGYDVDSARHIAARLLSQEGHTMERVRQNEATEMIGRYAEPKIQAYFDRALQNADHQFREETEGSMMTPYGNAGQMLGASIRHYQNTDPAKVWEMIKPEIDQMSRDIIDADFILEAEKHAEEEGVGVDSWLETRALPMMQSQIQAKFEQMAIEREMPKNTMDYIWANIQQSLVGTIARAALESQARRRMKAEALQRTEAGQGVYNPGFGAKVAGGAAAMLPDMLLPYGGPFGLTAKLATKPVQGMTQTLIADGMRPLLARITQSSISGGLSLGAFEGLKGGVEGALNPTDQDSYLSDNRSAADILTDTAKRIFERGVQSGFSGLAMVGGPLGQKISNGRGVLANTLGWGAQVGVDAAGATALSTIPKIIQGDVDWKEVGRDFASNVGTFAALGLHGKSKEFASLAKGGKAWNGVEFTQKDIDLLEDRYLQPLRKFITETEEAQKKRGLIGRSSLGIDADQEMRDAIDSAGTMMYNDIMRSYAVPRELKVKVAQALGMPVPEYAMKLDVVELEKQATAKGIEMGWIDAMNYDYNKPGGVADKVRNGDPLTDSELTLRLLFQDNQAFNEALKKQQSGEPLTDEELELISTNQNRMNQMYREYAKEESGRLAHLFEEEHGMAPGSLTRMMKDAAEGKAVDSNLLNEYEEMLRDYNAQLDEAKAAQDAEAAKKADNTAGKEQPAEEATAEEAPKVNRVVDNADGENPVSRTDGGINQSAPPVSSENAAAPEVDPARLVNEDTGNIIEVTLTNGNKAYVVSGDPANEYGRVRLVDAQGNKIEVTDESGYTIDRFPADVIASVSEPVTVEEFAGKSKAETQKAEAPKEEAAPTETTPAMSRIKTNEKGEPLWEESAAEDTAAALIEDQGSIEEASKEVDAEIGNLTDELNELTSPEKGKNRKRTSLNERRKKKEAVKDVQKKLDYWNSVKQIFENGRETEAGQQMDSQYTDGETAGNRTAGQEEVRQQGAEETAGGNTPEPRVEGAENDNRGQALSDTDVSGGASPVEPAPEPTAEQKVAQATVKKNIGKRFEFNNQDGTRSEIVIDSFKGDDKMEVTRQDYDSSGQPKGDAYKQDLNLTDVGNSIVNGALKPVLSTEEKLRKAFKGKVGMQNVIDVLTEEEQHRMLDAVERKDQDALQNMTNEFLESHKEDIILNERDKRNANVSRIMDGTASREEKLRRIRKEFQGFDDAVIALSDEAMQPTTLEEYVADLHSRQPKQGEGPIAYFSYDQDGKKVVGLQDETGHGTKSGGDTKGYAPWLAPKGKGMSLQQYAETIHSQLPEAVQQQYSDQDVRNAIIEVFGSAERPSDITTMVIRRGIIQAEQAARRMEQMWIDGAPDFHRVSPDDNTFAGRLSRAKEQTNTEPSEAQKEKGNYKKGHISFGGYDFVVENPEGSFRRGTDRSGKSWEQKMNNTYGYILGKKGKDGDHLDMFINDAQDLDNWDGKVYVVDQVDPETGKFDEHKIMYGFDSEAEARDAYLSNYEEGWQGLGRITGVDKETFDKWLDSSDRKIKEFADHSIPKEALGKAEAHEATKAEIDKALVTELGNELKKSGVPYSDNVEEGQPIIDDYNRRIDQNSDSELIRPQKVTDQQTLDELEKGPTVKRYRAMQLIDGKLYPPMSAKVAGEMREPTEIGVWEQAEERPDLIKDGKFVLNKGQKGQGNVPAAYNPYFHTSTSGLNDQFTSAYKRPELVVVEVEIPESELTSGYKAEGAKDAVGNVDWHSGVVNGQLPADRQRQVTLSRYSKVNRVVPDSEVAEMIAKQLEGTDIEVPYNVVTPALRAELEKRGVKISKKPAGSVTEDANGNSLRQQKVEQPIFVSNALKAVEGISQEKATPDQWLAMIQKNGGLKAGEDKWLGLSDWLNEQKESGKKSVTKQEVEDYIRQNQIEIEEETYSERFNFDNDPTMIEFRKEFDGLVDKYENERKAVTEEANAFDQEMYDKYGEGWANKLNEADKKRSGELTERYNRLNMNDPQELAFDDMVDQHGDDFAMAFELNYGNGRLEPQADMFGEGLSDAARYYLQLDEKPIDSTRLDYTTAGLDNKREIALTVPTVEPYNEGDHLHFGDAGEGRAVAWIRFGDAYYNKNGEPTEIDREWDAFKTRMAEKYGKDRHDTVGLLTEMTPEELEEMNRIDKKITEKEKRNAGRVLVIDEIQSKRHQDAREKGYKKENRAKIKKLKEKIENFDKEHPEYNGMHTKYVHNEISREEYEEWKNSPETQALAKEHGDTWDEYDKLSREIESAVPDAPFEKNWHELAMKRMLRYAAENGYDKIAWTTGNQQAERYNIGDKIKEITVSPNEDGTRTISLGFKNNEGGYMDLYQMHVDNEGKIVEGDFAGQMLSEVVGKDLAVKLLGATERQKLDGEDLRIGGEGMKGFYDDILPRFMNKYGKKWGVKVGEIELPDVERSARKMWSVDVTPEMKESVMQGQPMFFKTPDGHAYGFTYKGKIYVDPRIATAETPIHEYGHLWSEMKRQTSPDEWNHIKDVLLHDRLIEPFIEKVRREYPELEGREDDFVEEVLTQFSGKHGAERLHKMAEEIKAELGGDAAAETIAQAAVRRVKGILNEFWKGVCDMMGWKYTNAEDIADAVLRDMLNGVNPVEKMREASKDLKTQQEIERTLMGVHNISEEKLKKALKQGGLANPSLAVFDTRNYQHTDYGEISLIPRSSLIDSRTGRNAGTFSGDAWTPTYPNVERFLTKKGDKHRLRIAKEAAGGDEEMERHLAGVINDYVEGNGDRMHFLFLKQKGLNPEVRPERTTHSHEEFEEIQKIFGEGTSTLPSNGITKEQNKALLDLMTREYEDQIREQARMIKDESKREAAVKVMLDRKMNDLVDENGNVWFAKGDQFVYDNWRDEQRRKNPKPDWYGTDVDANYRVAKEGLAEEYEKWKQDLLNDEDIDEKLFAGWTADGQKRYLANTVQNASRLMNREAEANAYGNGGVSATKSVLLKKLKTLSDIRKYRHLLKSEDQIKEQAQQASDEWFDIIKQVSDMQTVDSNHFINIDIAEARLQEAITKRDPIGYLNKEYGYDIDRNSKLASDLMNFIEKAKEMPVKYFETKFRRPVGIDEFAIAVVPTTTSPEVVEALRNAGLEIRTYEKGDHGDPNDEARIRATMDAVQGRDDIMFQKKPMVDSRDSDEAKEFPKRMQDWLSEENLSKARGKSRDEILEMFGSEPQPVAFVPKEALSVLGEGITDNRIYSSMGYFIDHAVNHHPAIAAEKYNLIQDVLSAPDDYKEIVREGKRSVAFIKKIDRYNAVVVEVEKTPDGKIIWHKSFFDQKKEPYAKYPSIRPKDLSSGGGVSPISRSDESTTNVDKSVPGSSLPTPDDIISEGKDMKKSDTIQEKSEKSSDQAPKFQKTDDPEPQMSEDFPHFQKVRKPTPHQMNEQIRKKNEERRLEIAKKRAADEGGIKEPSRRAFEQDAARRYQEDNDAWKDRHGLTDIPRMEDGRVNEKWKAAEKDRTDPRPNILDYSGDKEYREAYNDYLEKIEKYKPEDTIELTKDDVINEREMQVRTPAQKIMNGIATTLARDFDGEQASDAVREGILDRRKNIEELSADDSIYINDLVQQTDRIAKEMNGDYWEGENTFSRVMNQVESRKKGLFDKQRVSGKDIRDALPFIIEAPMRRRDIARDINQELDQKGSPCRVSGEDIKVAQEQIADLRADAMKLLEVNKAMAADGRTEMTEDEQALYQHVKLGAWNIADIINDSADHQGVDLTADDVMASLSNFIKRVVPDGLKVSEDTPEIQAVVNGIRDWYRTAYTWLDEAGMRKDNVGYFENYVNHVWDAKRSDADAYDELVVNRQPTTSRNMNQRQVRTYMDGLEAGLVPQFSEITDMMGDYSKKNILAWANKKMLSDLSFIDVIERNDEGEVIAIFPMMSSRPPVLYDLNKYDYFEVPGVGPLWVYNDASDNFAQIFEQYKVGKVMNAYDNMASLAKKIELSWSGFHAGALSEVYAVQNSIEFGPKKTAQYFYKYLIKDCLESGLSPAYANPEDYRSAARHYVKLGATDDYSAPAIQNMSDTMVRFIEETRQAMKNKGLLGKAGAGVVSPIEVMAQAVKFINEGSDKILWTWLHDGLKIATFKMMEDRTRSRMDARFQKKHPEMELEDIQKSKEYINEVEKQLDRDGQYVNDMFGGQHWELINISPKTLRRMRRFLLSPDWLISTQRHFLGAFGYGDIHSKARLRDFNKFLKAVKGDKVEFDENSLPGLYAGLIGKGANKVGIHGKNVDEWAEMNLPTGRKARAVSSLLCYAIGVNIMYDIVNNSVNALMRYLDEQDELEKEKQQEGYISKYKLMYPDGMKWFDRKRLDWNPMHMFGLTDYVFGDYGMKGNALGKKTHVFGGHYKEGAEVYLRTGKQFKEFPDFWENEKGELEFPRPLINRLMGKANPNIRMLYNTLNYYTRWDKSYDDKQLEERIKKLSDNKTVVGVSAGAWKLAENYIPFWVPTQNGKNWIASDMVFPSSKGFSAHKAREYFEQFMRAGDEQGYMETVKACIMNGMTDEQIEKAATSARKGIEAEAAKKQMEGTDDLQEIMNRFDAVKDLNTRQRLYKKIYTELGNETPKPPKTYEEFREWFLDFQDGVDSEESRKTSEKYMERASAKDMVEEARVSQLTKQCKAIMEEISIMEEDGISKDSIKAFKAQPENKQLLDAWEIVKKYKNDRKENPGYDKYKKELGKEPTKSYDGKTHDDNWRMAKIRGMRNEMLTQVERLGVK